MVNGNDQATPAAAPATSPASPAPPTGEAAPTAETESACCKLRKRQRILEAAARAFAHQDFHKVCTEHIAAAAGMGKGTLFRYFPTKEELFVATLVYSVEVASAELDRALAGLDQPLERLECACENLIAFYRANDHLFDLLHHHRALNDQAAHREFHDKQNALRGKVAEIVRAGQAAGCLREMDPVLAGRLLFGMLRTAMRCQEFSAAGPHQIACVIMDLFIRGAGRSTAAAAPPAAPPGTPG